MGQILSEPVTEKHSSSGTSQRFAFGASAMQGWRIDMEDAHTTLLSTPEDPEAAFFAVFDGHGGANVAKYSGKHVHELVLKSTQYSEGNIGEALESGFLTTDEEMLKDPSMRYETSGCTAVAIVLKDNRVYCANAGDSRCIYSKAGMAIPLSYDHKPSNPDELRRIKNAGGFVEFGRVNGNLALSRAIGDFLFKTNTKIGPKEQAVTAFPDVISAELTDDTEFIVLACDGIWDVLSNQQVVDFVRERIAKKVPLAEICEQMMDHCLAPKTRTTGAGCDNMTVVIVAYLNNDTYEALADKCSVNLVTSTSSNNNSSAEDESENYSGTIRGAPRDFFKYIEDDDE